jgi:hypothetical protein
MITLNQKYLSIHSSKANDFLDADPFKDDGTLLSEDISWGSSDHDDNSTWDPREDEYNNITDNSFDNDNLTTKEIKMTVTVSPFTVLTVLIK